MRIICNYSSPPADPRRFRISSELRGAAAAGYPDFGGDLMRAYLSENASQIIDGLLFGLGVLAVYLGAVFTGALVRSLGGAGSKGITLAGRYVSGWFYYLRGDDRDIVNVTLNMIVDSHLAFDTLVADRKVWFVWPNAYRVLLIRRAAKRTMGDNPVILFPQGKPQPKTRLGRFSRRFRLDSRHAGERGHRRERQEPPGPPDPENDYKATYGPLISLISEKCANDNAIDFALGRPMEEYRFVVALTYEKLHDRRARHLRAMVMWEPALLNLPEECPRVDFEEHKTRFRTLQAIARQYRAHPECFGIVKIWRPKELYLIAPVGRRRDHRHARAEPQGGTIEGVGTMRPREGCESLGAPSGRAGGPVRAGDRCVAIASPLARRTVSCREAAEVTVNDDERFMRMAIERHGAPIFRSAR